MKVKRTVGQRMLTGFVDAAAHPITPAMIDEAARIMLARPVDPPCGVKERPHLISPKGGLCVRCGDGPFPPP